MNEWNVEEGNCGMLAENKISKLTSIMGVLVFPLLSIELCYNLADQVRSVNERKTPVFTLSLTLCSGHNGESV